MINRRSSFRYAKALLNVAKGLNKAEQVSKDMTLIGQTIRNSDNLFALIKNPVINLHNKRTILTKVFKGNISDVSEKLFYLLEKRRRLDTILDIVDSYQVFFNEYKNIERVEVITCLPLKEEDKVDMNKKIETIINSSVTIENIVDKSIIGGLILRFKGYQYDGSIFNAFKRLEKKYQ
ncbi:ATP synthase F1 subunit delta [Ichthyobacterium seriolicida]|uniref:ATP synthase subunit delta n=1 Tax=Ichthyobacterium seriolicida TaxID=242600 RepID=A0A1J1DZ46_9FLAO|nr:ATP synthase F1 subunit delta [Ichthyobacterium seriolicida]BAV95169.1 ATP synthase subunit delta [Ichthyobacterium seriolicida]